MQLSVTATRTDMLYRMTVVTYHPAELTFPLVPQPVEAVAGFSDSRGIKG